MTKKINSIKMKKQNDFLDDFVSLKTHKIVHNDDVFIFEKDVLASETNKAKIPVKYKNTLLMEKIIKE